MIIRQMAVRPGQGLDLAMITSTSTPLHKRRGHHYCLTIRNHHNIIILVIIIIIIICGRAGQFNGSNFSLFQV